MGLRLFITLLAIWLLYSLVRHALRQRREQAAKKKGAARPPVDIVCCAHCGTHLPQPEALLQDGRYYCCKAHLVADDSKS